LGLPSLFSALRQLVQVTSVKSVVVGTLGDQIPHIVAGPSGNLPLDAWTMAVFFPFSFLGTRFAVLTSGLVFRLSAFLVVFVAIAFFLPIWWFLLVGKIALTLKKCKLRASLPSSPKPRP
jgi:hypothetical protein